jgi:hypothetical protein
MSDNTSMRNARVSAVIPTIGRAQIGRAIASVRAQRGVAPIEVIVVADLDAREHEGRFASADTVLFTGGKKGGSVARNLGIAEALGDFVAFLDDDDEWLPDKTRLQLDAISGEPDPSRVVASSRHVHVHAHSMEESSPLPKLTIAADQTPEEYLFRRRAPSSGRASMYTSSLVCSKSLAERVPWNGALQRHQDWDWVIRLAREGSASVVQLPEALVRIETGTGQSVSAGRSWAASLEWAEQVLSSEPQVLADFLAAQTMRYALNGRAWQGVRAVAGAIRKTGRIPAAGPLINGAAGLAPRQTIERLLVRKRRPTW